MNKQSIDWEKSLNKNYVLRFTGITLFLLFFCSLFSLVANSHSKGVEQIASVFGEIKKTVSESMMQQKKRISGIIMDQNGEAIIGANIVEIGTSNGTITDIDGNFSLEVGEKANLKITYIGYEEQVVETEDKTSLHIILQEDAKSLDEVVVIGYGVRVNA